MAAFVKKIEVRWADFDANRHVAATAYGAFFVEARFAYLESQGVAQADFRRLGVGPAVLWERFHYLREIASRAVVYADLRLKGASQDNLIFRFAQSLFDERGEQAVYAETTFGWLDLAARKLVVPPPEIDLALKALERCEDFQLLTKSDTRIADVPRQRKLDVTAL